MRGKTSVNEWFGGAVDLGNRYLHACLNRIKTGLRIAPAFDCLRIQTNCRPIRHIQFAQKVCGGLAIVHRRATDKTEAG